MTTSHPLQSQFAERIGGASYGTSTAIYKFEKIKRAKRAALEARPSIAILDLGIGENDGVADTTVQERLRAEIGKFENRGYADNGVQEFKDAAARFMKREFNVVLDPTTQINHCIGTKSALSILPMCFINPGDVTLMTTPGYPVAGTHTKYLGGTVYAMPLLPQNNFLPDFKAIPETVLQKTKLMVLNYPNSPTGALAPKEFFQSVIEFAHARKICVIHDAAHLMLTYNGERPVSFLETPGALDIGIELHSMSKGFDMIGWRLGFVAGNEKIVRAFADVKDNTDSGQNIAIQKAAVTALDNPEIPKRIRAKYKRRLEKLVTTLRALGFDASIPGGTYFLYTKAPKGVENSTIQFATAEDASQYLIREHSISTVPWDDAGAYLRFSTTYKADTEGEEDAMMTELKARLEKTKFLF